MRYWKRRRPRRKKTRRKHVYTVWDPTYAKKVAVKSYSSIAIALRERTVMKALGHDPRFPSYYGFFIRGGRGHIVMEWIAADTLRTVVKKHGALDAQQTIQMALSILKGLDTIHRQGFVHGDLHHENVLVVDLGTAKTKIIDFEHAVRKGRTGKAPARRRLVKVPPKLAPETRGRMIDDSYDIYGIGFMCAYMLLGKEPKRAVIKNKRKSDERALWKVIEKALHKNPTRRFRSAREMMSALAALNS